jgi:hypothetical protein
MCKLYLWNLKSWDLFELLTCSKFFFICFWPQIDQIPSGWGDCCLDPSIVFLIMNKQRRHLKTSLLWYTKGSWEKLTLIRDIWRRILELRVKTTLNSCVILASGTRLKGPNGWHAKLTYSFGLISTWFESYKCVATYYVSLATGAS